MYLFLLSIFIHEAGHVIFGLLVGFKNTIIHIYPFGGISIFNIDLNTKIYKEFISLLGGIIFQLLFLLLVYKLYNMGYVTNHVYILINKINYLLISFNFMPILPLDGGRLLNLLFDYLFPYKLSYKISIFISIIFVFIFLFSNISIFRIILCMFLIKSIIIEIKNINIKYNNFLFERYIHNYKFYNIKVINNINYFKRDYYHIINSVMEEVYLSNLFDKRECSMLKYSCL